MPAPVWMHPELFAFSAHPDYDVCARCTHYRRSHLADDNCLACVADSTACYQFEPKETVV